MSGKPVARVGDTNACDDHKPNAISTGSPNVFFNGIPVARMGDKTACDDTIVEGIPNILINGQPIAHVGSKTAHGGVIVSGSPTIIVGSGAGGASIANGAYKVASGDTLWDIAKRLGVSLAALIKANPQILNPDVIHPGDEINIPGEGQQPQTSASNNQNDEQKQNASEEEFGRKITHIVIHCSATEEGKAFRAADIKRWHVRDNGWQDIGYHYVICLDGTLDKGRSIKIAGAHVKGHNKNSIGICLIGGLRNGKPASTYTQKQFTTLNYIVHKLVDRFPLAEVLGHRDFPGVSKACPCFDVASWWNKHKSDTITEEVSTESTTTQNTSGVGGMGGGANESNNTQYGDGQSDGLYNHHHDFKGEWPWLDISIEHLACKCCGEYYHCSQSLNMLQKAIDIADKTFLLNSAHRCVKHNKEVGGAVNSEHLKIAFDIDVTSIARKRVYQALQQAGFSTFGFYKQFIHTDKRPGRRWWGEGARPYW
ncbi:PAAR domain-containing protein [Zooshikella sp. RANM57]|uniref:PAAR domain-containing protein n=1 Tax=Zooshikella sp. RANM57 TaxID=3425863 RepID=UPI003D6F8C7A